MQYVDLEYIHIEIDRLIQRVLPKNAFNNKEIKASFYQDGAYTMVLINLEHPDISGIGFSKCNPNDQFRSFMGLKIATGRAMRNLAKSYKLRKS